MSAGNNKVEILINAKDEASGIFGSLQSKVAAVGVAIAGYFGISAFIGAVKGASELEAKLSEVKAVSGATAAEMVLLRKAAEDAGATTKFTATEGADALGNLARSGLSAKDAIAALPAVLTLAQAGGIGLAEASDYVTKAVMGMGLSFNDAGRVADVLAAGANGSNTSVTGLSQALSYAAPVAKSLGLGLEFTVAVIGKFADAGIDASRAGTALNAVLSQFSDPASKFRQELGGAGIITGNFEKALRQLAAAGPAGEKAILAVGTEAGPALRALLNQGIGALDDLKGKLDGAKGSAAATAAVMEDNLKGSFNSLSSAWDTVKNALATPVLPVLRDGVTQLSTALSSAVSDGTIGRFGDAIATAFQGGLKWAREFLGTVNFTELTTRMQAFATRTQEVFTQIGEYATNAGNIVKTTYGVMSAGTNAVLTAVYGVGVAFAGVVAGVQRGLALLYEGMAKITFGSISANYKQLAADVRLSADATSAASHAMATKAIESFTAMGDGAQLARKGWDGLTDGTKDAQTQATASEQAFKTVAETLREVAGDATATGQKAQAAGILQKEAANTTRAAVAELKTEYEAALAAGNVQLAVDKLQAMQGALKATGEEAKKLAAEKLKEVADAFTGLGITSQASLKVAAESARGMYETIKASANSTAIDAANAFKVYAEKAIAANNGVATEAIKSEARMRGLEVQADNAGKTIVKSMGDAASATGRVGSAAGGAANEFDRMAIAANKAALSAINQRYERPGGSAKPSKPGDSANNYDPGYGSQYANPGDPKPRNGDGQTKEEYDRAQGLKGQNAVDNTLQFSIRDKLNAGTLGAGDVGNVSSVIAALKQNAEINKFGRSMGGISLAGIEDDQKWQNLIPVLESFVANQKASDQAEKNVQQLAALEQAKADAAPKLTPTASDTAQGKLQRELQAAVKERAEADYAKTPEGKALQLAIDVAKQKATAQPQTLAPATAPSAKTYTVNIVGTGNFTASSDADAQALIRLLQSAKLSSGL